MPATDAVHQQEQPWNRSRLRSSNERLLLGRLRTGGAASRAQLARETGLSKPTVSSALAALEAAGLVHEVGTLAPERGRTAVLYAPDPAAGHVLGIDVGRGWLRIALSRPGPGSPVDLQVGTIDLKQNSPVFGKLVRTRHTVIPDAGRRVVWLRTPALMKGYFQREDLTRAVVRQGWFYSGDIGYLDARGDLFLTGRAVDEINKGGLKIQPQDVELAAAACPAVRDVCAFAVEDALYCQNVALAFVTDGSPGAFEGLQQCMRDHLSRHKLPSVWYQLDAVPRTSRGKVNRKAVAALCGTQAPLKGRIVS